MTTKVVNLYKNKYDIYCGRAGKGKDGYFGNPYSVKQYGLEQCLILYGKYFYRRIYNDQEFKHKIQMLKDKVLACFCKPEDCHADLIAEYLDKEMIVAVIKNNKFILNNQEVSLVSPQGKALEIFNLFNEHLCKIIGELKDLNYYVKLIESIDDETISWAA